MFLIDRRIFFQSEVVVRDGKLLLLESSSCQKSCSSKSNQVVFKVVVGTKPAGHCVVVIAEE
jgi:hypothetical protein